MPTSNTKNKPGRSPGGSSPSSTGTTRLDAIVAECNRIDSLRTTYLWGGGHSSFSKDGPWDCSGSVSQVLHNAGYKLSAPFTTFDVPSLFEEGKGKDDRVIIWCDTVTHVYMQVNGLDWGTGSYARKNGSFTGPGWINFSGVYEGAGKGFKAYHLPEGSLDEPADVPSDADLNSPGAGGNSSDSGGSGGSSSDSASTTAAAFSTFLEMPGIINSAESLALSGQKSLMNDQSLFPFIEQLSTASLRSFMSMPNGNFYAFYPDYFGGLGRTPYWQIEDVEIIDGKIQLTDDALATHVYVVGDISGLNDGITITDKVASGGVVTVFNAFMADFLNGLPEPELSNDKGKSKDKSSDNAKAQSKAEKQAAKTKDSELQKHDPSRPNLANKEDALNFLKKYGARPWFEEAPMVRSPIFEAFLAYQRFCIIWSQQFATTFEFTFMPELFPGGIVAFPTHGLQCYVQEVVHNCSYEDGFTTTATLSAPAALRSAAKSGKIGTAIDPTRAWVHSGMIRAFALDVNEVANVPKVVSNKAPTKSGKGN